MLEEQRLVEQAQRGDHNAFAQLVETYQTPVYNLAYRMLGNANDAEDAAQETFLRAFAQLKKFRTEQKFATWLLSIDAHYCIDRLRRKKFQWLSLEDDGLSEMLTSDAPEPDDQALRHEDQREIEKLLERLSPASRLVVVLRYWHDQPVAEIAKTTGDSVSAVKVKLHRARQMLAREISGVGQIVEDPRNGMEGNNLSNSEVSKRCVNHT
ncbi:MAG: sigma-70 family RNA polymerase sigma factor [Chloroflexi bacterium]|nr:sigma-70 family RNA polymerase sigma factor [Chloroflexota bacterium]